MDCTRFFVKWDLFNEVEKKKRAASEIYENVQGLLYKSFKIILVQLLNLFKTHDVFFSFYFLLKKFVDKWQVKRATSKDLIVAHKFRQGKGYLSHCCNKGFHFIKSNNCFRLSGKYTTDQTGASK